MAKSSWAVIFSPWFLCVCAPRHSRIRSPRSSLVPALSLTLSLSLARAPGEPLSIATEPRGLYHSASQQKKKPKKKSTHMKLKNARALTHSSPCVYTFSAVLKCLSLSRLSFCLLVFLWDFFFGTLYTDSGNINIGSRAITISTLNYV